MITFKCKDDLNKLESNNNAYPIIERLINLLIEEYDFHGRKHDPEQQGFIILCEPSDTGQELQELNACWQRLQDIEFDGISRINDEFLYGPYIGTDEYGLAFVIPNELLPSELRQYVQGTINFQ